MGYRRDSFYRFKELYDAGGELALQESSRRKPVLKNRVEEQIEAAVVQMAFEQSADGQRRTSNGSEKRGLCICSGGVRCLWLRHDLETFDQRLQALSAQVAQEGLSLTEDQLQALKRARQEKEAHGEIEMEPPGSLGSPDTFYASTLKGVGRSYQQTFIDTYTCVAVCKLYDRQHALCAADTYGDALSTYLYEAGHTVSVINPAQIKAYARSRLSRAKTDKADSTLIAQFCAERRPPHGSHYPVQCGSDRRSPAASTSSWRCGR